MLTIEEIRELHDRAYSHNQVTRERASDDLVFAWVTQWDDNLLGEAQLQYRGEFNIIRKAIRSILSDLTSNPVSINFEPTDETQDDNAEFVDGLYRTTTRSNDSKEAFDNAQQEMLTCGIGAWRTFTEYQRQADGELLQVIKREPIYEANNNLFIDPNAQKLDKSDAMYMSLLVPYSEDGYRDLVKELTGEDLPHDDVGASFAFPEESYVFPWRAENKKIYVVRFYHKVKKEVEYIEFTDLFGASETLDSKDKNGIMQAKERGLVEVSRRKMEIHEVTEYIAGHDLLQKNVIAGEEIPVTVIYGERAFVEGEEHYEGVIRLAKDPQRLRNFQLSYLADIVSRSPRRKPIFTPEQIQGHEAMYNEAGSENNYAFLLQNRTSATGEELPLGAVGEMPEQTMPQALIASIELSRQAVEDVANSGVPQDIADPDLSGKAVLALQARIDAQSFVYQDHHRYGLRRDAAIWLSMAKQVYDQRRKMTVTKADGTRSKVMMNEQVLNPETLEVENMNTLSGLDFDVYSEIGPNYQTQKQQSRDELLEVLQMLNPQDPMYQIMLLKYTELLDGVQFEEVRDYARQQLVLLGVREPETEKEMMMLQQAQQQQQQQQDPNMLIGQAELLKGQATQMDAQTRQMDAQTKAFDAQTKRMAVQVDAQEAGFNIEDKSRNTDINAAKAQSEIVRNLSQVNQQRQGQAEPA